MTFDSDRYRGAIPLFIVLLALSVLLAVAHKRCLSAGHTSWVAAAAELAVSWPERATAAVLRAVCRHARGLFLRRALLAEQRELEARVRLMRRRNILLRRGMEQPVVLFGLATERQELLALRETSIRAHVIGRGSPGYHRSLLIDVGRRHGVGVGDTVVAGANLVGRVAQAFRCTSVVHCLCARANPMSVRGVRSQEALGELVADLPGELLRTVALAPQADVREGDLVITSGLDRRYPGGLIVGRVCRYQMAVDPSTGAVSAVAWVRPAARWRALTEVSVLRGSGRRGAG